MPPTLCISNAADRDGRFDGGLIRACQGGDNEAWEQLVARHTRRVHGICYRFTRRECEACDLTQEVFLRVFRTIGTFRAEEMSFVSWLTSVTRNLLIDHYRKTRRERLVVSIEDQWRVVEERSEDRVRPDRVYARTEASERLQAALRRLEPDLREPISLYDVEELSYSEIAGRMGIPVGTVKSRLNRGRGILAHLLQAGRQAA